MSINCAINQRNLVYSQLCTLNNYECTIDQELADAAAYADRFFLFTRQAAALFARNEVMAAILKSWLQIEHPTSSIDTYLLEEQSCQNKPNFIPIRFEMTEPQAFWRGWPNKKNQNKMSSDMRSVPDLKSELEMLLITDGHRYYGISSDGTRFQCIRRFSRDDRVTWRYCEGEEAECELSVRCRN